jgi:hypothetical protein
LDLDVEEEHKHFRKIYKFKQGVFNTESIENILENAGYKVKMCAGDYSKRLYSKNSKRPLFVALYSGRLLI